MTISQAAAAWREVPEEERALAINDLRESVTACEEMARQSGVTQCELQMKREAAVFRVAIQLLEQAGGGT